MPIRRSARPSSTNCSRARNSPRCGS
jgi:hypothetical protein